MVILRVLGALDDRSGGPLRAVLDLSARADCRNHSIEIIGIGPIRIHEMPISADLVHAMQSVYLRSYEYSPEMSDWLEKNISRFAGVVIHGMWHYPQWITAHFCKKHHVPYAYFPHGMMDQWSIHQQGFLKRFKKLIYWHLIEKRIATASQVVLFTAEREMRRSSDAIQLKHARQLLVPYGVEGSMSASYLEHGMPAEQVLQPANKKIILFLSRLHPKKNLEFLIRCWSSAKMPDDWRLVIAGTGDAEYVGNLKGLVSKLALADSVSFVGHVGGVDKWYLLGRAEWFVLPSQQENFGIAVLEALRGGCGIAISEEVYLSDWFPQGAEVLPLSTGAWVEFLRRRATNPEWLAERRKSDRSAVLPQFELSEIAASWNKTIEGIFSSEKGTAR